MNDLPTLPDELRELLRAEADVEPVPPAARARMSARLGIALPVGPSAPPPRSGAANGGASSFGRSMLGSKLVVSAVSLALGAGAGAMAHATLSARSQRPAITTVFVPVPRPAAPLAQPLAPTEAAAPIDAPPSPVPTALPTAASSERQDGVAQLRAERLLLETARTAMTRADYESALHALRKHAAQFPNGQLAEERDVLLVQALQASGDAASARRQAEDFKKHYPQSLQRDAIDGASRP